MILMSTIYFFQNIYVYTYFNALVRPIMTETTALGAAMMAGMAEGINVWDLQNTPKVVCDTFTPSISEDGKFKKK